MAKCLHTFFAIMFYVLVLQFLLGKTTFESFAGSSNKVNKSGIFSIIADSKLFTQKSSMLVVSPESKQFTTVKEIVCCKDSEEADPKTPLFQMVSSSSKSMGSACLMSVPNPLVRSSFILESRTFRNPVNVKSLSFKKFMLTSLSLRWRSSPQEIKYKDFGG